MLDCRFLDPADTSCNSIMKGVPLFIDSSDADVEAAVADGEIVVVYGTVVVPFVEYVAGQALTCVVTVII